MRIKKCLAIFVTMIMVLLSFGTFDNVYARGGKGYHGGRETEVGSSMEKGGAGGETSKTGDSEEISSEEKSSEKGHFGQGSEGKKGSGEDKDDGEGENEGDKEGKKGKGEDKKGGVAKGDHGNKGSKNGKENSGTGKGSKGKSGSEGKITVKVTVKSDEDELLNGVTVTFVRTTETEDGEEIETTSTAVTIDGIAEMSFEAGGSCTISGASIPGYITPTKSEEVKLTGEEKIKEVSLVYIKSDIPVSGVKLNKDSLELITGYSEQLTAVVMPENANNREISWSVEDQEIAFVDDNGKVTAKKEGNTQIKVTTAGGSFKAICNISVKAITGITEIKLENKSVNEVIRLPREVKASLSDNSTIDLPVTWTLIGHNTDKNTETYTPKVTSSGQYFKPDDAGTYVFEGQLNNRESVDNITFNLTITVNNNKLIAVESIKIINENNEEISVLSLFTGDEYIVKENIAPETASNKEVIWESSNTEVVDIETIEGITKIVAKAPGTAIISVLALGAIGKNGDILRATCLISVAIKPAVAIISPASYNDNGELIPNTKFDSPDEIYIDVRNLTKQLFTDENNAPVKYFVKIEQKGSTPVVGDGSIEITPETIVYKLIGENAAVSNFKPLDSYNNEYFVYMSQYENYPKDDEKTLKTNFKIGSAVPSILKENVKVTASVVGGEKDGKPEGILFLLCRENGININTVSWKDYLNPFIDTIIENSENGQDNVSSLGDLIREDPYKYFYDKKYPYKVKYKDMDINIFTDEVKMFGITDKTGQVIWFVPKETLKLGGYVLLSVEPNGYINNLNLVNPDSEDGALLKEVTLKRDGGIERNVVFKEN